MKEYDKCNFCLFWCDYFCIRIGCDGFKPDSDKIISKSKEKSISVSDVISLMMLEGEYGD